MQTSPQITAELLQLPFLWQKPLCTIILIQNVQRRHCSALSSQLLCYCFHGEDCYK